MFVKKYRNHDFKYIIGLPQNLPEIKKGMPPIMLYGIQGTGKSLLSEAIAKKLGWQKLRLNCSDFRGIDVGRDLIKPYMMTMSNDGNPKILMLEEADAMTADLQKLLRQYFEDYADNCIVILTLNYINKIIDPLKSRCVCINMNEKDKHNIYTHLEAICNEEKIDFDEDALNLIIDKYYPDIRAMMNKLEEFHDKKITKDLIVLDENKISELFELLKSKSFSSARKWCLDCNWGNSEIINQLFRFVLKSDLEGAKKVRIIEELGECDFRLGMSTDAEIQMSALLVKIIRVVA